MSRWYRAYTETVTDPKLGEVALVAGCSRSVAIAAWHCILESAAQANAGGAFDATPRRVAVILGEPIATIEAVFAEMTALGMIGDATVKAWAKRQFESDSSTERSRKHREAKRNGDATLQGRSATPPDTEAETEKKSSLRSDSAQARPAKPEARLLEAGVSPAALSAWKAVRSAKRSGPLSDLAIDGFFRECAAAGITPQRGAEICAERSWVSVKADWLKDRRQTGPPPRQTAGEAAAELEAMFGNPHDPDHSREPSTTVPRLAYSAGR